MTDQSSKSLKLAVLTVSDTRTESTDTSGQALCEGILAAGHQVCATRLVKDDIYHIRAMVSEWIHSQEVNAILITGGTGFTDRDSTPEAVKPLLDQEVPGFGELFRHISYQEIGTSTIQSRALAGFANRTFVACLPGSTNACRTAWNHILKEQLDSNHKPCNFVTHMNV